MTPTRFDRLCINQQVCILFPPWVQTVNDSPSTENRLSNLDERDGGIRIRGSNRVAGEQISSLMQPYVQLSRAERGIRSEHAASIHLSDTYDTECPGSERSFFTQQQPLRQVIISYQ